MPQFHEVPVKSVTYKTPQIQYKSMFKTRQCSSVHSRWRRLPFFEISITTLCDSLLRLSKCSIMSHLHSELTCTLRNRSGVDSLKYRCKQTQDTFEHTLRFNHSNHIWRILPSQYPACLNRLMKCIFLNLGGPKCSDRVALRQLFSLKNSFFSQHFSIKCSLDGADCQL